MGLYANLLKPCPRCNGELFGYRSHDGDEFMDRCLHQCLQCARLFQQSADGSFRAWGGWVATVNLIAS